MHENTKFSLSHIVTHTLSHRLQQELALENDHAISLDQYEAAVEKHESEAKAAAYTASAARLNTRNRRLRGKEFFSSNKAKTRTTITTLAPFDQGV
eukprot:SAG11_NODE_10232_length_845_cov_1.241287_1_plen_96_part_00